MNFTEIILNFNSLPFTTVLWMWFSSLLEANVYLNFLDKLVSVPNNFQKSNYGAYKGVAYKTY